MFLVAFIFALVDKFQHLSVYDLLALALLVIISILTDFFSGVIGAKYGGASRQSIIAGLCGMIVGLILLPPFGGLLGIFFGVLIWEIVKRKDRNKAIKAATASVIGSLAGMVVSLILSVLFIVFFILLSVR